MEIIREGYILCQIILIVMLFYAPNFKEVEEAYWFGPVRPSVRLTLALGQEPLEIGS